MPKQSKPPIPLRSDDPIDSPAPEISGDLVDNPNLSPSSLLQSAKTQQEAELTDLQNQMDALSDEYAARARSIVLHGLEEGRQKARTQILTIDIPSFFDLEGNGSPLPSPQKLALSPSIEGEPPC